MSDTTQQEGDIIPPVSNSEIQAWKDCHRKWYLAYYLGWGIKQSSAPITSALRLGGKVHRCLELYYRDGKDIIETLNELYDDDWAGIMAWEQVSGFTDQKSRDKLDKEKRLALAMLEGYVAWIEETGADEGIELVGTEVTVEVESGHPGVRLRGKLDQRVRRVLDDAILFLDFKTAANLENGPHMLPIEEQMPFYQMLELLDSIARNGTAPAQPTRGALYRMLKKVMRTARATPPFYDTVEIEHNRAKLHSMWLRTHKVIGEMLEGRRAMDDGGDHQYWMYPRPSNDCTWKCDFFSVCPMLDDGSDWQAMLEEWFEKRNPYARYEEEDAKNGGL